MCAQDRLCFVGGSSEAHNVACPAHDVPYHVAP